MGPLQAAHPQPGLRPVAPGPPRLLPCAAAPLLPRRMPLACRARCLAAAGPRWRERMRQLVGGKHSGNLARLQGCAPSASHCPPRRLVPCSIESLHSPRIRSGLLALPVQARRAVPAAAPQARGRRRACSGERKRILFALPRSSKHFYARRRPVQRSRALGSSETALAGGRYQAGVLAEGAHCAGVASISLRAGLSSLRRSLGQAAAPSSAAGLPDRL